MTIYYNFKKLADIYIAAILTLLNLVKKSEILKLNYRKNANLTKFHNFQN